MIKTPSAGIFMKDSLLLYSRSFVDCVTSYKMMIPDRVTVEINVETRCSECISWIRDCYDYRLITTVYSSTDSFTMILL
jgi:hypothetical protein